MTPNHDKEDKFVFNNTKGITYEVIFRKPRKDAYGKNTYGICVDPNESKNGYIPKIYISPYLTKKSELNTSIHEIAHAFFWDKSETDITRFADVCSNFLYKNGWRLEHRKFQAPSRKKCDSPKSKEADDDK
jgi:hypothetical protein